MYTHSTLHMCSQKFRHMHNADFIWYSLIGRVMADERLIVVLHRYSYVPLPAITPSRTNYSWKQYDWKQHAYVTHSQALLYTFDLSSFRNKCTYLSMFRDQYLSQSKTTRYAVLYLGSAGDRRHFVHSEILPWIQ